MVFVHICTLQKSPESSQVIHQPFFFFSAIWEIIFSPANFLWHGTARHWQLDTWMSECWVVLEAQFVKQFYLLFIVPADWGTFLPPLVCSTPQWACSSPLAHSGKMCLFSCNKEAENNTLAKSHSSLSQYSDFLHFWQMAIPSAFPFISHGIHFYCLKTSLLWQLLYLFLAVFMLYTNLSSWSVWSPASLSLSSSLPLALTSACFPWSFMEQQTTISVSFSNTTNYSCASIKSFC